MHILTGYINEHDLARDLGKTVWALRAWRKRDYGPPVKKLGKTVLYRITNVQDFIGGLPSAKEA